VPRLGEILIAKGVLTQDGLRSGLDASRRNGGRVGTWLVRLGLINEAALLDALAMQTGCPVAKALDLATAAAEVRALIPQPVARRHMAMPFSRQGRTLDVAMASPNDLAVVEELGRMTGLAIRPYVATEAALTASLAMATVAPAASAAPPPAGAPRSGGREWRQFWKLDATLPELHKAMEAPAPSAVVQSAATFPFLAPIVGGTAMVKTESFEDLAESLSSATHRDQVAGLLLGALAGPARRVALFSVMSGRIMGWAGAGLGLVEDDFRTLILPLDRPSVFLNLVKGADIHVGPFGGGEGNALLLDALGDPTPKEAVIVPIRLRGKVASFIWIDRGGESAAAVQIADIQETARIAGLALEILVLRQKLKAGSRLTDGGATD
jgi:hypothetical protein